MTAMFLANGFIIGSWAPQIPLVMSRLAINETLLGVLILLSAIAGALIMAMFAGFRILQLRMRARKARKLAR